MIEALSHSFKDNMRIVGENAGVHFTDLTLGIARDSSRAAQRATRALGAVTDGAPIASYPRHRETKGVVMRVFVAGATGAVGRALAPQLVGPGDVVGMTMASEATLASELGIPYASLCTVDNFCNGIVDEPLTFEAIRETQRKNAALTRTVVANALERVR